MKKTWMLILALFVVSAVFANGVLKKAPQPRQTQSRYEVVAYSEDFETGAVGYTHADSSVITVTNNWHIYNYGGTQGDCWWMGDPALAVGGNIGGYYDHQYLVLDTPSILVPTTSPTLTFKLRFAVEPLGTSGSYNGWDACNIRVSTNGGTTWTVLTGSPSYNSTSTYSFGSEFGEGVGIPGWGGSMTTWTNATFSMAAYAGTNVKVRFAFASDPAVSTINTPTLFGMMVDDIALGTYTNNGVNDGQMTWASLAVAGGDLWHVGTDTDAPSPTHVYACQNGEGTYNAGMENYLYSPPITLPSSGDIRADFMVKSRMVDADQGDYIGWQISINNGASWLFMSNPYADPLLSNYVFIPSDVDPPTWGSMVDSYSLDGYISDYAGMTVIFRWYLGSNGNAPVGTGVLIDDFKIFNNIFVPEPSNLTATVSGTNVTLNWSPPGGGGLPGWLAYDNGENSSAIGNVNDDCDVAIRWASDGPNNILPYIGMNITQIKFYPCWEGLTYAVRVYTGATGVVAYSQTVANPVINDWNTITLTTPFTIPTGQAVWVGYSCNQTDSLQYPAGIDAGPGVHGFGDMLRRGTSGWGSLYDLSGGAIDGNWNIEAFVDNAPGRPEKMVTRDGELTRELTGYKVYRDDVAINTTLPTVTTYLDAGVPGGIHHYTVTGMYGVNESLPSNIATCYVLPTNYSEIGFDDGSPEQNLSVGSGNIMYVKVDTGQQTQLKFMKVYVTSIGSTPLVFRIYDNNGPDGQAGSVWLTQFTLASANVALGWNFVQIPTGSDITIADGSFYLAMYEYTNSSTIGLDTNSNGHSYTKIANVWAPLTTGEIMLHCIAQLGTPNSDENQEVPIVLAAANYPNPFNQDTAINYSVPKSAPTTLTIYNTKGQVVRTLLNANTKSGNYSVTWNGKDNDGKAVANGVYFYRLQNGKSEITRKMLLTK